MDSSVPKETMEVVISTSDDDTQKADSSKPVDELLAEQATVSLAEAQTLRNELHSLVVVPISVTDEEKLKAVADGCDKIYYWALAESRFPDHSSVLAECEVVDLLFGMLSSERGSIVTDALRSLTVVLAHPVCVKLFSRMPQVHHVLFAAMRRFPNKHETQAVAIHVARLLAIADFEPFLISDLISGVLAAMEKHPSNVEVQKESCFLFAGIVGIKRRDVERDIPVGLLLAQVGVVGKYLVRAYKLQPTCSELLAAIARVCSVMSSFPQNLEALVNANIVQVSTKIVESSLYCPTALSDAVTTIANLSPEMDLMQKKSITLIIKRVMTKTSDRHVLASCFALIAVFVKTTNIPVVTGGGGDTGGEDERSQEEKARDAQQEHELKMYMAREQVPQMISVARELLGVDDSETLVAAADVALGALVINMWR